MIERDRDRELVRAAVEILRPIVHQMIASGVAFGSLEARLRELYVREAESSFRLPGRPQTDSRLAVLTGINRKEIHRIRNTPTRRVRPTAFRRNLGADLVSRWRNDPGFSEAGAPRPLPLRSRQGPSFVKLVRGTTTDLRPRAILDELTRAGVVEVRDRRTVVLRTDAYVPRAGEKEKLAMLAEDPPELIGTMLHNILSDADDPWLQQKVAYDNLGERGAAGLRARLRRRAERFLKGIDQLISRFDRDRTPTAPAGSRRYAGLGVYYFQSPHDNAGAPVAKGNHDDGTKRADSVPSRDARSARRGMRRRTKRHRDRY